LQIGPFKSWFAGRRLVWPAVLSIGGSALPFLQALGASKIAAYEPDHHYGFLAAGGFSLFLGVALLTVSTLEFVSWNRRRTWGTIVACLYLLFGAGFLGNFYFATFYAIPSIAYGLPHIGYALEFFGYFSLAVLGFLGGAFGALWKIGWNGEGAQAAYAGPARLVLIGSSTMLFLFIPFGLNATPSYTFLIFIVPALLILKAGLELYKSRWSSRLLGIVIVLGSIAATVPFLQTISRLVGNGSYSFYVSLDYTQNLQAYFALTGMIIAIIGGLQTIAMRSPINREIPSVKI